MSFWYNSEAPNEAIQLAADLNMPLMVFASDNSPLAQNFQQVFDAGSVNQIIEGKYIAVKVVQGTETFKSFIELMPIHKVPSVSIYLEGEIRGLIDECDPSNTKLAEDLSTALDMIQRIDAGEDINSLKDSLGSSNSTTLNLKPLTEEEKAKKKQELQDRLEERRKERLIKEKEEEKVREAARREMGKELTNAKAILQEKEAKQILDLKIREKREDQEAKRRVREQIAQDKAERAARRQKNQDLAQEKASIPPVLETKPAVVPTVCRLSIRLIDGSAKRLEFKPEDKLSIVINHLRSNFLNDQPFSLAISYPNKPLTGEDENRTLLELGLCPSNSLVVKRA